MKKTETILRANGSVYQVVDYIDDLILRIAIVKGEITEPLFYKNEHGGMTPIDKFGCSDYNYFEDAMKLLHALLNAQMDLRKKEYRKEKEEKV